MFEVKFILYNYGPQNVKVSSIILYIKKSMCVCAYIYIYIYTRAGWKIHRLKSLYDGVISAVNFFTNWIQTLQHQLKKWVDHNEVYVEK